MAAITATPSPTPKSSPPSLSYTTSSAEASPATSVAGRSSLSSSPFGGLGGRRGGYLKVGGSGLIVESDTSTTPDYSPAPSLPSSVAEAAKKYKSPIYAALLFTACVGAFSMFSGVSSGFEEEGAVKSTADQVTYLPGFGEPYQKQYAGTVTVNPDMHGKLAYVGVAIGEEGGWGQGRGGRGGGAQPRFCCHQP